MRFTCWRTEWSKNLCGPIPSFCATLFQTFATLFQTFAAIFQTFAALFQTFAPPSYLLTQLQCGPGQWRYLPASKPHDFDSLSNCWKSLGQSGITIPSGECLRCRHCAVRQCEGSLWIFLGQTLSLGFSKVLMTLHTAYTEHCTHWLNVNFLVQSGFQVWHLCVLEMSKNMPKIVKTNKISWIFKFLWILVNLLLTLVCNI